MTEAELLSLVKDRIGVTGVYQDNAIKGYIKDVKDFMLDAGVPKSIVNSDASVGVISRGVNDLWKLESGTVDFSNYFKMRVIQLAAKTVTITEVV